MNVFCVGRRRQARSSSSSSSSSSSPGILSTPSTLLLSSVASVASLKYRTMLQSCCHITTPSAIRSSMDGQCRTSGLPSKRSYSVLSSKWTAQQALDDNNLIVNIFGCSICPFRCCPQGFATIPARNCTVSIFYLESTYICSPFSLIQYNTIFV